MSVEKVTVNEAAIALGISQYRVYALIREKRLSASKFAGTWAIDLSSLDSYRLTAGLSRPMTEQRVWNLARRLNGEKEIPTQDPQFQRTLRKLVTCDNPQQILRWFANRYRKTLIFSTNQKRNEAAYEMQNIFKSGESLLRQLGANFDSGEDAEIIVPQSLQVEVIKKLRLTKYIPNSPRIIIHVVNDQVIGGMKNTPQLILACDLAMSSDARTREFGNQLIMEICKGISNNE